MKIGILLGVTALGWTVLAANTWYVDDAKYGASGTGESLETAFGTIQEAVTRASAGDTVLVAPGTYNRGSTKASGDSTSSRVVIDKDITVKSIEGAAKTIIVGAPDFTGEPLHGLGPDAVRCVAMSATGSVLEGFTLTGGYVYQSTGSDSFTVRGGGVNIAIGNNSNLHKPFVVDCVISNNVATRGGGAFGGTLVRCFVAENRVYNTASNTTRNGAGARSGRYYNCVFTRNDDPNAQCGSTVSWIIAMVNCTVMGNHSNPAVATDFSTSSPACVWNSIIHHNAGNLSSAMARESSIVSGTDYLVVSPIVDDWRPIAGSAADGEGSLEGLATIPEEYRDKDFYGNPRMTDGTVCVGAAEGAVTPKGGRITFANTDITLDGHPISRPTLYHHAAEWPAQVYLKPTEAAEGLAFFGTVAEEKIGSASATWYTLFNDRAGGRWMTLPDADTTINLTPVFATLLWVDCASTAAEPDGSAAAPFPTIQQAADATVSGVNSGYRVIRVRPGTYDTGWTENDWGRARVIVSAKNALLTSEQGPENTIIVGASDPDAPASDNGCGPNALRCVFVEGDKAHVGISGFTLTGGHSQIVTSGGDSKGHGGAFRFQERTRQQALDCIITNNVACRGPAGMYGWCQRCLMADNYDQSGINAIFREGRLSSCVLRDNLNAAHTGIGQNVWAYQCTVLGVAGKQNVYTASSGSFTILAANCLFLDGNNGNDSIGLVAGCFADTTGNKSRTYGITYGAACVVDKDARDFRPLATTPLVGGGDTSLREWAHYTVSDFQNRPIVFTDGKPTIGAYQHTVGAVVVMPPSEGGVMNVTTNALEEGVTLSGTMSSTERNLLGISVGGEYQEGVFNWTVAGAEDMPPVEVRAVCSPDWYVGAVNGNDANNGWTAATAKKTLATTAALAVSGDVVHALPGVYNVGETLAPERFYTAETLRIKSRVVVPRGVTLVADGPRDETVIEGAPATLARNQGSSGDTSMGSFETCLADHGVGSNATRCVTLLAGARIRGFTLRGGRTDVANSATADNHTGSAVFGLDYRTCFVEDCLMEDNRSGRATLARVTADRCVIRNNYCMWNRPGATYSLLRNCLFTENHGDRIADYCYGFYNCTFHKNYGYKTTSTGVYILSEAAEAGVSVPFVNCICTQTSNVNKFGDLRNSIFLENITVQGTNSCENLMRVASADELLDANGAPLKGSIAVDGGDISWYDAAAGDKDVNGGQRVYNGAIDVGAVEYDWRPDYKALLTDSRRLAVTAASPEVEAAVGGVYLPGGELTAEVSDTRAAGGTGCELTARVTGTGTLAVRVGDVTVRELTAADGETSLKLRTTGLATSFVCAYTPGENETGGAYVGPFAVANGLTLIFR